MWELDCEKSWAPKNWCFWTVVWRRLLRVPWTARRSNQSILKEISPGCSLEGLMLKLKVQYFGHLLRRVDSLERPWCWEGLEAGGEGYNRGWDGWMASWTRWTWVWVNSRSWWWTGRPGVLQFMGSQRVRHDWETKLNWTEYCYNNCLMALFLFKFIFNWRIITLQYCVAFCYTSTWISHKYTYVPTLVNLPL